MENNFQSEKKDENKNNYKLATTRTTIRNIAQKMNVSPNSVRLAQEKILKIRQSNDGQNERIFL